MPSSRNDPLRVESTTLANGLEVGRQSAPAGARSVALTFIAPAGWAYDGARPGLATMASMTGVAAAGRWNRVELAREIDRLGATVSAHCDPESAELTLWGPSPAYPRLVELMRALVLEPRFEREDTDRVRRQLRERQLREAAQPESRAEHQLLRSIFPAGHAYGQTGNGTARSVRTLRPDDLRRFHAAQHPSSGSMVVVTGALSLDAFARDMARVLRDLPDAAPAAPRERPARRPGGRGPHRIPMPGRSQVEIRIGGPSIARSDPDYPGGFLANEVLGGRPLLSRLFQTVREHAGLAYHSSSDVEAMRWGGYWQVQAGTGPERVTEAERLLRREVERIRTTAVPSAELDRIRESAIGELPLALETTASAHSLALDVAYHHLGERFLSEWPATLRALSPKQVRDSAGRAFGASGSVTVLAGPLAER